MNGKYDIPSNVVTDCISRFLIAGGDIVLSDRIHLCTYLEQAYWFYIDCWVDDEPEKYKYVPFVNFVERVLEVTDIPCPGGGSVSALCLEFSEFKHRVGTYGGILINENLNKVLLVQSFNGHSWGFPKGKIENGERVEDCAVREVKEEIDYDMSPYLITDCYAETSILEQPTLLYFICGVPEETKFKTNTRKEIGSIKWFDISNLPAHKKDKKALKGTNYTPNNFFIVIPFVKQLRDYVILMQTRCHILFKAPYFNQDKHYFKYLKEFHPAIYKSKMEEIKKKKSLQQKTQKGNGRTKYSSDDSNYVQTAQQQHQAQLQQQQQQLLQKKQAQLQQQIQKQAQQQQQPSILAMLQSATLREQESCPDVVAGASGSPVQQTSEESVELDTAQSMCPQQPGIQPLSAHEQLDRIFAEKPPQSNFSSIMEKLSTCNIKRLPLWDLGLNIPSIERECMAEMQANSREMMQTTPHKFRMSRNFLQNQSVRMQQQQPMNLQIQSRTTYDHRGFAPSTAKNDKLAPNNRQRMK